MRQSAIFSKTRKEAPKDEVSQNAALLIRAGFVHKEMAGVYSLLPFGLRVLNKITGIIREEMNMLGGQEISLTSLQEPSIWNSTGRWEEIDVWFKTKFKNGADVGLATTHEEPLTNLLKEHLSSYKDLPFSVFQIQTKFRNEIRAKSGLMRGREFLMKDLYSFSRDEAEHQKFYEKVKKGYLKIFKKVGLKEFYLTFASGGSFSKFSHEFQALSEAGEDTIYLHSKKKIAVNKEVMEDSVLAELGLERESLEERRSIEIGNIFSLGTKFSEPLGLLYLDEKGEKKPVIMGSYGIGLGRLMATVAETLSDSRGLVWPETIAPFKIHLLVLGTNKKTRKKAEVIYNQFVKKNIEVLFDDREATAGEKFADADLIGIPWRIIISEKTEATGKLEAKERKSGKISFLTESQLFKKFDE